MLLEKPGQWGGKGQALQNKAQMGDDLELALGVPFPHCYWVPCSCTEVAVLGKHSHPHSLIILCVVNVYQIIKCCNTKNKTQHRSEISIPSYLGSEFDDSHLSAVAKLKSGPVHARWESLVVAAGLSVSVDTI